MQNRWRPNSADKAQCGDQVEDRLMEMAGEAMLNAARDEVWAALNDPEILRQAIPGCETPERTSDAQFTATIVLKVGPIKARFSGRVTLSEIMAPESYTMRGV